MGKIYITNDYSQFKKLIGNRRVKKNISLEKSIAKIGILVPIEINEKFEILDGQNRFEIAKKLGKEILYRFIDGGDIQEVIELNSITRSWTVEDYINKYVTDENSEYQKLMDLIVQYDKIPISSLIAAAEGYLTLNTRSHNSIREGNFQFYNYEVFCLFLTDYYLFLSKTGIKVGQTTFFAFLNLYTVKIFNFEHLVKHIYTKVKIINENVNVNIVTEIFLEAYNYKLEKTPEMVIMYELNKKENPVIKSKRNTILLNTR